MYSVSFVVCDILWVFTTLQNMYDKTHTVNIFNQFIQIYIYMYIKMLDFLVQLHYLTHRNIRRTQLVFQMITYAYYS